MSSPWRATFHRTFRTCRSVQFDLELPVIPLLTGHMQLNALTIDGLMVAIAIPAGETTESQGMAEIGQFISNIVHSPVSSNFELRDTKLDLVDHESGFTLRYVFEAFVSEAKDDGSMSLTRRVNSTVSPGISMEMWIQK